jgi:ABC-2 type transport system ATP-binding protein
MSGAMIETIGVSRNFGSVVALDQVSLTVAAGTVLGLLGHNGAGKTTLVNVLSTVLRPTCGTARVAGFDVVRQDHEVRRRIGLTGQFAAVDDRLPGTDNLVLIARLLGAGRREARRRADELLEVFALTDAAGRPARTYSGGMRRRLDLAASLVGRPEVIFLDEPTTGLDPTSRTSLWEIVRRLVREGATVLLTTQYLEEADRLADRITVLSGGRVVASGSTAELKAEIGTRAVHVTLTSADDADAAVDALGRAGLRPALDTATRAISTPVAASTELALVVRALDEARVEVAGLSLTEPTLDDVYLALARGGAAVPA